MGTMPGGEAAGEAVQALGSFRSYLLLLARMHLDRDLQGKCAPSDIVQETLLEACKAQKNFRGRTFGEQAVWLRKMLVHNALKAARDLHREKRDVRRELSLEEALARSSRCLGGSLAAKISSPSEKAIQEERILLVADAIEGLPEAERDVVLLHFVEGLSMSEIGKRLDRTAAATAGLLHRALKRLRELVQEGQEPAE